MRDRAGMGHVRESGVASACPQRTGTRTDIRDGVGLPVIDVSRAPLFVPGRYEHQGRSSRAADATARSGGCVSAVTEARSRRTGNQKAMVQKAAPHPADDQLRPSVAVERPPRGCPATGLSGSSGLVNVTAIVTMAYVRWTKGFTNCCGEICVTVARPPARRRGGGTPDDRAW